MAKTKQMPRRNPTEVAKAQKQSGNQSSNRRKDKKQPQATDTENDGNRGRGRREPTRQSKNVFFAVHV